MKPGIPKFLLTASAVGFGIGLLWLFRLRFEHGDVYPPYSSLRADPLGAMALYESLDLLPGVNARRDYANANRLPEERGTTYLHLAADPLDWQEMPLELVREIENFAMRGGRLVVTFRPDIQGNAPMIKTWTVPPGVIPPGTGGTNRPVTVTQTNAAAQLRRTLKQVQREQDAADYVNVETRWGFSIGSTPLTVDDENRVVPVTVLNRSALPLPMTLAWHSANYFQNLDQTWRTIYARGTNAVLIEKTIGAGTLVMASDSFFASNEALTRDRHADLLAWLVGPCGGVVFDEAHLGVTANAGVMALIWRYRLHGLVASLLLLLGLFVWKNTVSFIPLPQDKRAGTNEISGKDASAGFVNLLRRHIPAGKILDVCFEEWTKSLGKRADYTVLAVDRAQTIMEQELARPSRQRDPLRTYNNIAQALKSTGQRFSESELRPPANEQRMKPDENA